MSHWAWKVKISLAEQKKLLSLVWVTLSSWDSHWWRLATYDNFSMMVPSLLQSVTLWWFTLHDLAQRNHIPAWSAFFSSGNCARQHHYFFAQSGKIHTEQPVIFDSSQYGTGSRNFLNSNCVVIPMRLDTAAGNYFQNTPWARECPAGGQAAKFGKASRIFNQIM